MEDSFCFDRIVERKGSGCVKWDAKRPVEVEGDVIPLWVADMDFPAAPCIRKAMQERMDHGVFGYTCVPRAYYECVSKWFSRRHGWTPDPSWMIYTTGVVPGISAVIKALAAPGDEVVILTPVYNCFFSCIRNNDCVISESPLRTVTGPRYVIDFEDLERKCASPRAKILLMCNPHNPAGRLWTREELEKVAAIARRHGVIIVSDEIHCELVAPGSHYIPMAVIDQANCVTLCSPSKSFNIAGLQMATIVTDNPDWLARIDKAININEICDVNPFAPVAGMAAYSEEGEKWLDELNKYIYANYDYLCGRLRSELPDFPVYEMEATYLAWVDCHVLKMSSQEIEEELLRSEKVWVNAGSMYGAEGFVRINLATSRALLSEGLDRMIRGLERLHREAR
ncbi:MAG: pyridoxal phosphate-dependent aminotransferase [Bacteroidales bacterium]|nr:pyridoxal phosphate-dependent aminotransferase [Bacteroidales bacterium]